MPIAASSSPTMPKAARDRRRDALRDQRQRGVVLQRLRLHDREIGIQRGQQSADVRGQALPLRRSRDDRRPRYVLLLTGHVHERPWLFAEVAVFRVARDSDHGERSSRLRARGLKLCCSSVLPTAS